MINLILYCRLLPHFLIEMSVTSARQKPTLFFNRSLSFSFTPSTQFFSLLPLSLSPFPCLSLPSLFLMPLISQFLSFSFSVMKFNRLCSMFTLIQLHFCKPKSPCLSPLSPPHPDTLSVFILFVTLFLTQLSHPSSSSPSPLSACASLCPSFHSLRYELCATSLPHERIILIDK